MKTASAGLIPAAIGFRAHSGWAALVAVAGTALEPILVDRRRVELADATLTGSKQPYHTASEMEWNQAGPFIDRCIRRTNSLALSAIKTAAADLEKKGYRIKGCGVLLGSSKTLPDLAGILASHPLLHTAEGQMFRAALALAAGECSLTLATAPEREIRATAQTRLGLSVQQLESTIARVGKAAGSPWREDQKFAMLAAMLALAT